MRFRLSDAAAVRDFVRFFRRRDYLAVEAEPGVVEVLPIGAADELTARAATLRDLEDWKTDWPDVEVEPLNGPVAL
jgi:hypothetical protein